MPNEFKIIAEQPAFLVVDKTSGISTHHSPGDKSGNVLDLLSGTYKKLYPVMRLDNGTSGLLVIGLKPEFAREVKFIEKSYLAIVLGETAEKDFIDKQLTKKKFGTDKKIIQNALTKYQLLETTGHFSLLKIVIETGRHHQIRKHFRSIEHPVLGDFRHGYNEQNIQIQEILKSKLRLCLQCSGLIFTYLHNKYSYVLPLSNDLMQIWNSLQKLN